MAFALFNGLFYQVLTDQRLLEVFAAINANLAGQLNDGGPALPDFAVLMQISNMFKPEHADTEYDRGKYMLTTLGLQVGFRL
jgi:hypothetical protein